MREQITDKDRNAMIDRQAIGDLSREPKVDPNSDTWKAVLNFVQDQHDSNFMSLLRNRNSTTDELYYANGGLDCLESLLELGCSYFETKAKPPNGR